MMKDVLAHRIVLEVPFYTDEWVTTLKNGKLTSYDLAMIEVQK
ncbi:hypothetical protein SAMN04487897_102278 [Paenibacillus sp. yr247]|nr:hypothetical protein [Paenibacillus sp. yr247]SDN24988.1 hypothetical protein SAMN04487897_102278 [Paenibacillus sp. yr247]